MHQCDLARPACSRCQKLRIACVGCGKQRFRFQSDIRALSIRARLTTSAPHTHVPINDTARLQQAIVVRLQASSDIRYYIGFRYGLFLVDIPKRLGINDALDAAVTALLARHAETSMRQDQTDPRAPAAVAYNRALTALRLTLADPDKIATSETLCAVLLLTYCQVIILENLSGTPY